MGDIAQLFQQSTPTAPLAGSLAAYRNFNPDPNTPTDAKLAQLKPQLADHLSDMIDDLADDGRKVGISSGYRDVAQQQQLWDAALQKYGSPSAARLWVAPPGASNHNAGLAADLTYDSPATAAAVHESAPAYGLNFPMGNEAWHIEPQGIRGPGAAPSTPPATVATVATSAPSTPDFSRVAPPAPAQSASPFQLPVAAPAAPPAANNLAAVLAASVAPQAVAAAQQQQPKPRPVPLPGPQGGQSDPRSIAALLTAGLPNNLILS